MVEPDVNDCSVIDLGVALSSGKLTLLPQSLLERSDKIWPLLQVVLTRSLARLLK
jgi:hypothetical protein